MAVFQNIRNFVLATSFTEKWLQNTLKSFQKCESVGWKCNFLHNTKERSHTVECTIPYIPKRRLEEYWGTTYLGVRTKAHWIVFSKL